MDQILDTDGRVTLDGSGNGTVTLQPPGFQTWNVTVINVRTTQSVTTTPIPQCTVYLGTKGDGQIVAQTYMGNRSTATGSIIVQPSQPLLIEWTGGVAGSTATVSLYGTKAMR